MNIKHCIKAPAHEKIINSEIWYRLQCHEVISLLSGNVATLLFKTNVMFDNDDLV